LCRKNGRPGATGPEFSGDEYSSPSVPFGLADSSAEIPLEGETSRADPTVPEGRPTSGGRVVVTTRGIGSRRAPSRIQGRRRDLCEGRLLVVLSSLMAKVKPDWVRLKDEHHTPGWASLGHGFSRCFEGVQPTTGTFPACLGGQKLSRYSPSKSVEAKLAGRVRWTQQSSARFSSTAWVLGFRALPGRSSPCSSRLPALLRRYAEPTSGEPSWV